MKERSSLLGTQSSWMQIYIYFLNSLTVDIETAANIFFLKKIHQPSIQRR